MAWTVQFVLKSFEGVDDPVHAERVLKILLDALTATNLSYLRQHPETPPLYKSGVRYQRERPERFKTFEGTRWLEHGTGELFRDIPEVIAKRGGDCEDLCAWRCAELLAQGEPCLPTFRWHERANKSMLYHILVNRKDGAIEDPSRILGMTLGQGFYQQKKAPL